LYSQRFPGKMLALPGQKHFLRVLLRAKLVIFFTDFLLTSLHPPSNIRNQMDAFSKPVYSLNPALSWKRAGCGAFGRFSTLRAAVRKDAAFTLLLMTAMMLPSLCLRAQPGILNPHHEKRHEERRQIEQVEEKWRQAILHSDAAALEAILDEDYVGITASGILHTKEQMLEAVRSGKLHITSFVISDRKFRFYGKTALVTGSANATGTTPDSELNGSYRYTQVYVFTPKGGWKLASFEINRIRERKEHHEHESDIVGKLNFN
jgi:ketosteroid isomerase-like protein